MAESDEEIRIRLALEAQDAIAKIKQVRAEIDAVKAEVLKLSKEAQTSLEVTAKGMLKTFSEKQLKTIPLIGSKDDIKASVNVAKAAIAEYRSNLVAAVGEIQQAETSEFKAFQTQAKERQKIAEEQAKREKQLSLDATKGRVADTKQQILLQKELAAEEAKTITPLQQLSKIDIATQFRAQVAQMKSQLVSFAQQANVSYQDAAKAMISAFNQSRQGTLPSGKIVPLSPQAAQEMQANARVVNQALKELQKGAGDTGSSFSKLGDIFRLVFGFSVFGLVSNVLRSMINYLKEATQAGYDFSKAIFQLSAGINAIRRTGVEITFGDMWKNIQKIKKEFPIFSIPELTQGAAALINLTRDFGFAKEQIFGLQDAIIKLAIINGRAMDDVQRTVALAISSGYTEGLQRLGVSINRITIAEKANAMGFEGGYTALTEYQRALATYTLILEKTSKYQDDLNEYQKIFPGLIDASNASLKDFKAQLGLATLPEQALGMKFIQKVVEYYDWAFKVEIPAVLAYATQKFATFVYTVKQGWEIISGKRVTFNFEEIAKQAMNAAKLVAGYFSGKAFVLPEPKVDKNALKEFTDEELSAYENLYKDLIDLQSEYQDKYTDTQKDFLADLVKIDQDYQKKQKEIWKNYYDEVDKINADYAKEVGKIEKDYGDRIAEINKRTQEKIADINRDYGKKITDINRDYRKQIEDIEKDHQKALVKINKDYQKEIADLNEKYAKQIIKINQDTQDKITKAEQDLAYKIEDLNRETQNKLEDASRKYHENEIKAEQDYQEDLRKLREEFLFDLEDALRERDALQVLRLTRRYNMDKEERARQYEQDKADRAQDYQNELEDIRKQAAEKLNELQIEHQRRLEEIRLERERELAEAAENHQEDLANAAEKFQEELAQEREQYQERLADAAEQRAEKLAEAARQRQEDIAEAQKQRQEDLAEAAKQRAEDLATAAQQRAEDLAEAAKQRDEDLALAKEEWLQKRAERTKEYVQDLQDLRDWFVGRLAIIVKGFTDQVGATSAMGKAVSDVIRKVFGNGGLANISLNQFNTMISYSVALARAKTQEMLNYLSYINAMSNSLQSGQGLGGQPNAPGAYVAPGYANPQPGTMWYGGHASGAENMVVTRPKIFMAGEVPERIDVTPLSQLNSKSGGTSGKGTLEIRLGSGLEANIVDNTLGQFDIILRKELGKKR